MFSYYWVHGIATNLLLEREFRRQDESTINPNARAHYRKWFRDVCVEYFLRNPVRLGGPGKVVEIDETVLTRRKYQKGRIPVDQQRGSQQWYFGGVERGNSEKCFIVPVSSRDGPTLLGLVERFVMPGSIVISDGWKAYQGFRHYPKYKHLMINHSINFVDPEDEKIHTQTIESTWQKFKQMNRGAMEHKGAFFAQFIEKFLWKKKFGGSNALYSFWLHVKETYDIM